MPEVRLVPQKLAVIENLYLALLMVSMMGLNKYLETYLVS